MDPNDFGSSKDIPSQYSPNNDWLKFSDKTMDQWLEEDFRADQRFWDMQDSSNQELGQQLVESDNSALPEYRQETDESQRKRGERQLLKDQTLSAGAHAGSLPEQNNSQQQLVADRPNVPEDHSFTAFGSNPAHPHPHPHPHPQTTRTGQTLGSATPVAGKDDSSFEDNRSFQRPETAYSSFNIDDLPWLLSPYADSRQKQNFMTMVLAAQGFRTAPSMPTNGQTLGPVIQPAGLLSKGKELESHRELDQNLEESASTVLTPGKNVSEMPRADGNFLHQQSSSTGNVATFSPGMIGWQSQLDSDNILINEDLGIVEPKDAFGDLENRLVQEIERMEAAKNGDSTANGESVTARPVEDETRPSYNLDRSAGYTNFKAPMRTSRSADNNQPKSASASERDPRQSPSYSIENNGHPSQQRKTSEGHASSPSKRDQGGSRRQVGQPMESKRAARKAYYQEIGAEVGYEFKLKGQVRMDTDGLYWLNPQQQWSKCHPKPVWTDC